MIGPRKSTTYALHENRSYVNPYASNKFRDHKSVRNGLTNQVILRECFLKFNSDFEGGNLDAVIQRGSSEFDLFMRVDTNTKGHTNWFYF